MPRDYRKIIAALERKANDGACPAPERAQLLAKANELRIKHAVPVEPEPAAKQPVGATFSFGSGTMWVNGVAFRVRNGRVAYRPPTQRTAAENFNVTVSFGDFEGNRGNG